MWADETKNNATSFCGPLLPGQELPGWRRAEVGNAQRVSSAGKRNDLVLLDMHGDSMKAYEFMIVGVYLCIFSAF